MAWPNGQSRYVALTIPAAQFVGPLSSFPVLITAASLDDSGNLADEILDSSPTAGTACQSDGGDLRFATSADGSGQLSYELVTFSKNATPANASVEIWVLVDLAENAGAGTTIYMAWDTAGTTADGSDAAAVWANYKAVWHGDGLADSAGNAANLSATSSASSGNTGGKIGDCFDCPGSGASAGDGLTSSGNTADFATTDTIYLSCWANKDTNKRSVVSAFYEPFLELRDTSAADGMVYGTDSESDNPNPGELFIATQGGNNEGHNTGTALATSTWYLTHAVFDQASNELRIYVNGASDVTTTSYTDNSSGTGGDTAFYIGIGSNTAGPDAKFDEVRFRWGADITSEANFFAAEYANQNDPATFISEGTPQAVSGGGFQAAWARNTNTMIQGAP